MLYLPISRLRFFLTHCLARLVGEEHVGGETTLGEVAVGASDLAFLAHRSNRRENRAVRWLCSDLDLYRPIEVERLRGAIKSDSVMGAVDCLMLEASKSTAFWYSEGHTRSSIITPLKPCSACDVRGAEKSLNSFPMLVFLRLRESCLSESLASSSSRSGDEESLDGMSDSDDVVEAGDCSFSAVM